MTNIAEGIYRQYQGKIDWAKIVQSLKTDHPIDDKIPEKNRDLVLSYKGNRQIKIRTNEIEKYSKYLIEK